LIVLDASLFIAHVLRLGAKLATLDNAMRRAASGLHVDVLPTE
jgi:hypothetical protein